VRKEPHGNFILKALVRLILLARIGVFYRAAALALYWAVFVCAKGYVWHDLFVSIVGQPSGSDRLGRVFVRENLVQFSGRIIHVSAAPLLLVVVPQQVRH